MDIHYLQSIAANNNNNNNTNTDTNEKNDNENRARRGSTIVNINNVMANNENMITLKEGWLYKKGSIIRRWKKRWFILSGLDHRLYYSKTKENKFLGMILLSGNTWSFPSSSIFSILWILSIL